ncbi:hypothetical protein DL96DRAFT_1825365 [Flagelloscypha sp. PMI_526]|nr:hypothetical protein DL96DRAFT_1825365 [Flagelloscypha sp. PMI_526]
MLALSHGIRVITFDGPLLDATGLSELFILEDIAGKWAWDHGDDREGGDVRASEIFDIVGGTGIGGFYAILFSLNMTIAQVITSHKIIQNIVFSSDEWGRKDAVECAAVLKIALARIVEDVGLDIDLDGPFLSKDSLKCFICVLNDLNVGRARALRNYRIRSSTSPRCSIREAIHSTLADGTHIPPVYIHDEQFIRASSNFANPSYELMMELSAAFPKGSELACFVNLGASCPRHLRLLTGESQEEQARRVRHTEAIAQNLIALYNGLGACYFRLSVVKGVKRSTLQPDDNVVRVVKSLTVGYLEEANVPIQVDALVEALTKRHGNVSLRRLGSLSAEDGAAKLNTQVGTVHDNVAQMKKSMDAEIYGKIRTWLAPINQTAKLDACIRAKSSSTCGWLWDSPRVVEWKATGGIFCLFLFVLSRSVGTGKVILASHVVEALKNLTDECFVAYYYFEFTNPSTLSEDAFLRSIVSQLSYANKNILFQLHEDHKSGLLQPQLKTLLITLHELVIAATRPVYIIIDALDEFLPPGRKNLLESLLELSSLAAGGVCVMANSWDEVDIHEIFSGRVSLDFAIEKEIVRHDIVTFIDQQIAAKKWQSWPKDVVARMRNVLIDKADGM